MDAEAEPIPAATRRRLLVYTTLDAPYAWGGSENFWHDVLTAGVARDRPVRVVVRRTPPAERRMAELAPLGVDVVWREVPAPAPAERVARGVRRRLGADPEPLEHRFWRETLDGFAPDVVWLCLPSLYDAEAVHDLAAEVRRRGGAYWLVVQHVVDDHFPASDAEAARLDGLLADAERVVFIARRNLEATQRAVGRALPNALLTRNALRDDALARLTALSDPPEGPPVLLCLARLEPRAKGQHLLLEALGDERWRSRDWSLRLAGDGEVREALARLAASLGLGDRVEVGPAADAAEAIVGAHLCVLPSLNEGTPFAALECMAAGRPVVAHPVGGLPELLDDGRTGWLADGVGARAFGAALDRAWQERDRWAAVGAAASAHVAGRHRVAGTVDDLLAALDGAAA